MPLSRLSRCVTPFALAALAACSQPPLTSEECSGQGPCGAGQCCLAGSCGTCPDAGTGEDPDAGEPDAGEPDGGSSPCDGLTCREDEGCAAGTCWPRACPSEACRAKELCVSVQGLPRCLEPSCVGVVCSEGTACAGGACLSRDCGEGACGSEQVCVEETCVEPLCAGVRCASDEACIAGRCWPEDCPGTPCGSGEVCADGICVEADCVEARCPAGMHCRSGLCVDGCLPSATTEERCSDGADDDCDGAVDCADRDCSGRACADDQNACTTDVCSAGQCRHLAIEAGAVCRESSGPCDPAEICDGTGAACPADAFAPPSQECRASAGACDPAESCTGSSAECPPDALASATQECRAPAGACDVAESCTGSSAFCPADRFAPATQPCRPASAACDLAETCTGSSAACPADAFASAGTECRAIAGSCDVAERCRGDSPQCPEDAFEPASQLCRASAGVCDVAEHCPGNGPGCPADGFEPATTTCRPAGDVCDAVERCSGSSASCPADGVEPAMTVCRPSAAGCDKAETCDGTARSCPVDLYDAACVCPENGPIPGYKEFDGLRAIDASKFVLLDTGTWSSYGAAIDALGLPRGGIETLALDRTASRIASQPFVGFNSGFTWDAEDQAVAYWIPQGLAGATAGTRKFIAVGWHYDETKNSTDRALPVEGSDKGIRVSFADVTDLNAPLHYRHVLLVEPDAAKGFKSVDIHIGGIAWSGTYLYVADTYRGMRVFDLSRLLQVSTASDCDARVGRNGGTYCAYGYRYVAPQVGGYYFPSGLSSACRPRFSFISLDHSSSPDSILSGEYNNDTTVGIYSRIVRWPLDESTHRLVTAGRGIATATAGWYAGARNLQGVSANGAKFFLNATRFFGALYTGVPDQRSTTYRADAGRWAWMPEGTYLSSGELWVCTEGHEKGGRIVFFSDAAAIP